MTGDRGRANDAVGQLMRADPSGAALARHAEALVARGDGAALGTALALADDAGLPDSGFTRLGA